MLDFGNSKVAKVMAVQTRAQKLKAEQQIREDDQATARSGAQVWIPDHSQQEEEEVEDESEDVVWRRRLKRWKNSRQVRKSSQKSL